MSIQSRFRRYSIYKATKDSLGAINRTGLSVGSADVSISLISGSIYANNGLISAESTHTGLCYDTSVTFEKGSILTDDVVSYQVMFANPCDRLTILFLKMVV